MDPLSIASAAIGLSITCFEIASAIHQYVGEVKNVDSTVALFGQDMNNLSRTLQGVHDSLKRHGPLLSNKLRDESSLLDSVDTW